MEYLHPIKHVMEDKKLFLLDAYALIYRAYYALIRAPRVTSDGRNTSAIFGFCNTLDDILRKENPPYMAVCFDPPHGITFRHEAYPEYKAQRDKQPEDITFAIPFIKRIIAAYGIPVIEVAGYEADDVIGTLSVEAQKQGFTTYMMTPDKDYGQLVTHKVFMYRPALKGQGFEVRGPKEVCERYGISSPRQVIDLLALEGDASDNVPGCPGVGEKTASKLIAEFGSVENMLENINSLKGALKSKIETNADQIRFSKFLVTIKTDVPMAQTPDSLLRHEPDYDALREIYTELEFKSFLAKLNARQVVDASQSTPVTANADNSPSLFDFDNTAEEPVATPISVNFEIVNTPQAIADFVKKALKGTEVAISVYADGEEAMTAVMRGIALNANGTNIYVPAATIANGGDIALEPLFAAENLTITSHDVKRDMLILRRHNISWPAKYYDTRLAYYLLKPEQPNGLPEVAANVAGIRLFDASLSATERKKPIPGDTHAVAAAVCSRAEAIATLTPLLHAQVTADNQVNLLTDIELPLVRVLANMEWQGVRIDVNALAEMSRNLTAKLADIEQQCWKLAGGTFNVGSPTQVGEILFDRLHIDPKAKKTKRGGWSTAEDVLEKYRHTWPIVQLILDYRGVKKLLATYIDALPKLVNPKTGKIHTTYNQTVTATGRLSSTNPNLQNIPIRTDEGRIIRAAFVPDKNCLIVSADYSQIELRLMAALSGDPAMVEAFREGHDIHRATAAKIYHKNLDDVSDNERRNAKTANFGIIYGISAFGLSERLGIPRSEAKTLIDGYLQTYPRVDHYMSEAIQTGRDNGYVSTIMGRKRYLPEINSRNAVVRGYAERNAINAPLQGSAADIIKIAMIKVDNEIQRRGLQARMILQVHDELVFNVPQDELAQLQSLVTECMEKAWKGPVPLTVGIGAGKNWLEAH